MDYKEETIGPYPADSEKGRALMQARAKPNGNEFKIQHEKPKSDNTIRILLIIGLTILFTWVMYG